MNRFFRARYLVALFVSSLALLQPPQVSGTDPRIRKLLLDDSFQSAGMPKIFSEGRTSTLALVDALDDEDERVNLNAQLMLRLLGDERGIQRLHEWYEKPRPILKVINGPIPVPLRQWDYLQIEAILARPRREWRNDAINYLLALAIDGSAHAQELQKRMMSTAPEDESTISQMVANLIHGQQQAAACGVGAPQVLLRRNAFFLTPDERKSATIKQLAYANNRQLALLSVAHTFGNTFLVVLKRAVGCWKFQSVALYSTNN